MTRPRRFDSTIQPKTKVNIGVGILCSTEKRNRNNEQRRTTDEKPRVLPDRRVDTRAWLCAAECAVATPAYACGNQPWYTSDTRALRAEDTFTALAALSSRPRNDDNAMRPLMREAACPIRFTHVLGSHTGLPQDIPGTPHLCLCRDKELKYEKEEYSTRTIEGTKLA